MILLTHGYFLEEDPKEKEIMRPYVPLGILYISAFLESKNISHQVFDSTFSNMEEFKRNLLKSKPGIIGIYTNLMTKINVLKITSFIKEHESLSNTKVILGGPEIRYNALNYLSAGADLLVVGEGEQTFFEICDSFISTNSISKEIDGLAYLKDAEVVFTKERTLIKDIDSLPFPARKKVDLLQYGDTWKKHHGYSMYSLSTMRGCPYTCKWCSRAVYGGTYRRRSPALVVDEMAYLKQNYHPDRIWFVDDVFTISHKWLREFRNEIVKRNVIVPYEIITRADRMNDEVIGLLKETGCFKVWIGAESGSQDIIDAMDRRVEVNMVREMIIKTKKTGIEAGTFIMLGYPGEKRSDIKATIRHLNLSGPSSYTITIAYPITGTPFYNEVKNTIENKGNWSQITDRDYGFKRRHSKAFYKFALNWVHNEVKYFKSGNPVSRFKYKSKSIIAQALMYIS